MLNDALQRIRTIAEALDDDDPDKLEMMNVEGDYSGLMEWAIRKRTEQLATETANKELADLYKNRATRFAKKAEKMNDILAIILKSARETKFQGISGTVTIKSVPPKPIIQDENLVPDRFYKIERKLQKSLVNQAVKDGEQVPGVVMDNGGETITIRIK